MSRMRDGLDPKCFAAVPNLVLASRGTNSEQIALEGQDLPRTYLAQHELESVNIINFW